MRVFATGGRLGQTFKFGRFLFYSGVCTLPDNEVNALNYLRRTLEVKTEFELSEMPHGSSDIHERPAGHDDSVVSTQVDGAAENPIGGHGQNDASSGSGNSGLGANGNGPTTGLTEAGGTLTEAQRIREAIKSTDAGNLDLWTSAGLIMIDALSDKFPTITRTQINVVAGDLNRLAVAKLQSEAIRKSLGLT